MNKTMTTEQLAKKVKRLERELRSMREHRKVFAKMLVDDAVLEKVSNAVFDFDIQEYVSARDIKRWKSSLTRTRSSGT